MKHELKMCIEIYTTYILFLILQTTHLQETISCCYTEVKCTREKDMHILVKDVQFQK